MAKFQFSGEASDLASLTEWEAQALIESMEAFDVLLSDIFIGEPPEEFISHAWDATIERLKGHIDELSWERQAELFFSYMGKLVTVGLPFSGESISGKLMDVTPTCGESYFMVVNEGRSQYILFAVTDILSVEETPQGAVVLLNEGGNMVRRPRLQTIFPIG